MARIGIDATAVACAGKGHSFTQRRTVEALAALGLGHELVAFVRPEGEAALAETGVRLLRVPTRTTLVWELHALPRLAAELRLDAVLTLSDRLPRAGHVRYVVWLFEVPTYRIRATRRAGAGAYQLATDLLTQLLWKRSLRAAARVVAGSHATARDIGRAVPELRDRVDVVYPGGRDGFEPGRGPAADRYILHLGSSDARDNTLTALRAFALARPRFREPTRLVVAGDLGEWRARVEQELERARLRGEVDLPGRVSEAALVDLYRGARAYLDPTLFEGFGYQLVEAMACGTPVVASSTTSVPEVVGDAGLLCDPRSPEALADALVRVVDDAGLAADLRARGLERARAFTWERTARGLAASLEQALQA